MGILCLWNCRGKDSVSESIQYDQINSVSGVYTKAFLSQKGNAENFGHFKIVVNDTLEILLLPPYDPASKRSKEEVNQMEGKRVAVTGVVSSTTYMERPTLEYEPLAIDLPCFSTIESIALEK